MGYIQVATARVRIALKNTAFFLMLLFAPLLVSCEQDECKSYSEFTCKEIEEANYNVYFYFPDSEKEYYLGEAAGLSGCGDTASGYAETKNLTSNKDWSYICCMIAKGSSCYEKHR